MKCLFLAVLLAGVLLAGGAYRVVKKFPVPGDGGWDYLTVDSAAHRLYVSHSTQTHVLDTDTGTVVGSVPGKGVHGTAIATVVGRGFITNEAAPDHIAFAHSFLQSGDNASKHVISNGMAPFVVYILKMIDVDHDATDGMAVSLI